MSIGERISELRTQNNMSQYELAKAMDVSRQAVSKWENDQTCPDAMNLIRLSEILDTDIESIDKSEIIPQPISTNAPNCSR